MQQRRCTSLERKAPPIQAVTVTYDGGRESTVSRTGGFTGSFH
ncbi:MAG: hypothetical protein ACLSHU_12450 [Oscillospiraceae bacterium]